jgi:acetyltransferase-like isoleucine patch superfamily enzyme
MGIIIKNMKKKLVRIYIIINSFLNILILKMYSVSISFSKDNFIKGKIFIKNKGKIIIENDVRINSKYSVNPIGGMTFTSIVTSTKNAKIQIKRGARISNIAIFSSNEIIIGENVFIGGDTRIYDTDFHSIKLNNRRKENDPDIKSQSIEIQNGVFIGASVIILKGVKIGKNSVIGAGSVISKSIPENEIWAGNPAKFIKKIL